MAPALAYDPYYYGHSYYGGSFFDNHPYAKKALIGGGVGAIAGGLLSPEGNRVHGAVSGAMLGGVAGLGLEYLNERGVFSHHHRYW